MACDTLAPHGTLCRRRHRARAGRTSLGERAGFPRMRCGGPGKCGHLNPEAMLMTALPIENPHARRRRRGRAKPAFPARGPAPSGPARHGRVPAASPADGMSGLTAPNVTFAELGVPEPLVAELAGAGITVPFPIQAAALPDALAGMDILGRGRTGSGKTLGFAIPLAARLADDYTSAGRPRGLVLVPTRELASQVHAVILPLARAMGLTVATIFGGTGQNAQVAALRRRVDIVVACPGRLADLVERGHC